MFGAAAAAISIPALVSSTAATYGVPPALALAVAQQESGFNPNAVSSAGAIGVMQLMPATAASLGVTNPLDPTQNVNGGMKYLASLLAQFGDTGEALAAYNWGPGNVSNAISQFGPNWLAQAPTETQNYVQSILAAAGMTMQPVSSGLTSLDPGDGTDSTGIFEDVEDATGLDPTTVYALTAAAIGLIVLNVFND
jgi:soluble lytic murein transglycosylase-like protein